MCGILFSARWTECDASADNQSSFASDVSRSLRLANAARGPDACRSIQEILRNRTGKVQSGMSSYREELVLEFFASELRLRGDGLVVQPHEKDGDVLCWNGEIFEGIDIPTHDNDGVKLLEAIQALQTPYLIPDLFGTIEGPYAFVFYHTLSLLTDIQASTKRLFFARDPLGRRSLLMHRPSLQNQYFLLTSVSTGSDPSYQLEELSTDAICCLDIQGLCDTANIVTGFHTFLSFLPRKRDSLPFAELSKVNLALPPDNTPQLQSLEDIPDILFDAVDNLISHLDRSVMLQVQDIPKSGDARGKAQVAVLFSGGIDSTILAFLAHQHIPSDQSIDLLNVAFENPRKLQIEAEANIRAMSQKQKRGKGYDATHKGPVRAKYMVPDRITGLKELEELKRLCPGRTWNFVEVDVSFEESKAARPTVEALMWPGRTVMDLSLAMALYFASRGMGHIRSHPGADAEPYISTARVLLNGLGSDELLGGYGRHRTAFVAGGWQAVVDELQLELDRIPTRNLGRDDRVISSHGKETRHPFLSLSVVTFLAQLPVHFKVDPRSELGVGDKMLLRLATRKLGLLEACKRKKRAMQFGSHSARMTAGDGERSGTLLVS